MMKIIITMMSATVSLADYDCNAVYTTVGKYAIYPWDVCAQEGETSNKYICGDDDVGYFLEYDTPNCTGANETTSFDGLMGLAYTAKCNASTDCSYNVFSGYFLTDIWDVFDPCGTAADGEENYIEVAYVSECSTVLGTGSYKYACDEDDGTVAFKTWTNEDCSGDALTTSDINSCLTANECSSGEDADSSPSASGTSGAMQMTLKGVLLVVMASFLY